MNAIRVALAAMVMGCAVVTPIVIACNPAVTLDGPTSQDNSGSQSTGGSFVDLEASTNNAPGTLLLDSVPCTGVTGTIRHGLHGAFSFDVDGTCGPSGHVAAHFTSQDGLPYPQRCGDSTHADLSVSPAGVAPVTLSIPDLEGRRGCRLLSGPTANDANIPVALQLGVDETSGWSAPDATNPTHKLYFLSAGFAPPPLPSSSGLFLDGVACTDIETEVATSVPPPAESAWNLQLYAHCGVAGDLALQVRSEKGLPYPQSCSASYSTWMQLMRIEDGGGFGIGLLPYHAGEDDGPCLIESGPTAADASAPIRFSGTLLTSLVGAVHRVAYAQ